MTIYLVLILLILIMSAEFNPGISYKGRKRFLALSFVLLTIISGLRGFTVGADTKVYVRLFDGIDYIPISNSRFEAGFIIYLKVLHLIINDPSFLLFVSSVICIGTAMNFIYRFSRKPTISILLYILLGSYFSQMNTMRQSLAVSIVMWSFTIVLKNRENDEHKLRTNSVSALFIVLASSFHTIAIVAFIPWILMLRQGGNDDESKLSMQSAMIRTIALALVAFATYSIITRVSIVVLPTYYTGYFYGTWSDSNYFASLLTTLIDMAFLLAGTIVFRGKKLTNIQRFSVIMLGLSLLFHVLSMRMEIWGRISNLFGIYIYLIWVPEFLNEIRSRRNKWVTEMVIICASLAYMLIVLIYRPEWTRVVPYVIR